MKTASTTALTNSITIKLLTAVFVAALFASCSPKSSSTTTTTTSAYQYGQKTLTSCNHGSNASFDMSTSAVTFPQAVTNYGQVDNSSLKLKLNFAATNIATSGITIKFFKWQVANSQAYLDPSPLSFSQYDLSTQQTTDSWAYSVAGQSLSVNKGFYIQLNDYSGSYQVIRIVAYDSSGNVVAQLDQLIPQFYASPVDYQYNSNGTARSLTLQQLHPFYGTGKSAKDVLIALNQYCF